jgi:hypothetical protein
MSIRIRLLVFLLTTLLSCTIKYSPHAQNELINPYEPEKGKINEFGGGLSYNKWIIRRESDSVLYIPLYPQKSLSLFLRGQQKDEIFRGFAGLEGIIPFQWGGYLEGMPFMLWVRPNFGGQFEFPYMTMRLNIIPIDIWAGFSDNKPNIDANLNRTSFYQFTCLLHNSKKFNPHFWLGIRNSSSAIGPLAGIEVLDKSKVYFRIEYSLLKPAPYSFLIPKDELKDIQGTVHYITFGVFKRI